MADAEAKGGDVFQIERIRSLVELMKEYDLREIDLRQQDQQIRLRRGGEPVAASSASALVPPPPSPAVAPPAAKPTVPQPSRAPDEESDSARVAYIKSPMVGTFYARPNPKAEPYVSVGDHVEPETTVCVIEAMKVFNEIPAEVRGRIVAVLAEDEEPVEYGKLLFKVDTTG